MEIFKKKWDQIIADGPEMVKCTEKYRQKVENIRAEITLKYEQLLTPEKNLFKRILLRLKKREELKREIRKLTPPGNLYIAYCG